ncbi:hypothetical protein ACLB2K_068005 [Fragaria x ananassa]
MDRINELPDDVLCYIVSFLGLKDAVETSLISHRWRHLWKPLILTRPNLEFDCANMFGAKHAQLNFSLIESRFKRQVFIRRVHEFLRLYSGKKVDTLRVSFYLDGKHAADLDEWILFAIEKGAQVLDLELFYPFLGRGYPHRDYDFPHQLLQLSNSSSLKHLSLRRCVLKSLPYQFNQLTTLELRKVILDENFIACLFSNCLLLERLTLSNFVSNCEVGQRSLIITDHPRLTDLKVLYNPCSWGWRANLEISAANLVSLEHAGYDISCIKAPRHLRSVQIRNCHGTLYEIEFAILILKMATKLEKMVIDPLGKFYKGDGSWVVEEPYCCYDKSYELRNVDVDGVPHLWKRKVRAYIREKLKVVMTDAQVIIL